MYYIYIFKTLIKKLVLVVFFLVQIGSCSLVSACACNFLNYGKSVWESFFHKFDYENLIGDFASKNARRSIFRL